MYRSEYREARAVSGYRKGEIKYLDLFLDLYAPPGNKQDYFERFRIFEERDHMTKRYSWAIPSPEALDLIKKYGPIVEMGAGGGYWAMLLRERGVNVKAFDKEPGKNYQVNKLWTEVEVGESEILSAPDLSSRTLFLCWPPYASSMAYDSLSAYKGDTVIYIGESGGGCTGDEMFHRELEDNWEEIEDLSIPQWDGLHDYLTVYRRKDQLLEDDLRIGL